MFRSNKRSKKSRTPPVTTNASKPSLFDLPLEIRYMVWRHALPQDEFPLTVNAQDPLPIWPRSQAAVSPSVPPLADVGMSGDHNGQFIASNSTRNVVSGLIQISRQVYEEVFIIIFGERHWKFTQRRTYNMRSEFVPVMDLVPKELSWRIRHLTIHESHEPEDGWPRIFGRIRMLDRLNLLVLQIVDLSDATPPEIKRVFEEIRIGIRAVQRMGTLIDKASHTGFNVEVVVGTWRCLRRITGILGGDQVVMALPFQLKWEGVD